VFDYFIGNLEEHELEISDQNPIKCRNVRENPCCSKKNFNHSEKKKNDHFSSIQTSANNLSNFTIKKNYEEIPSTPLEIEKSKEVYENCDNCGGKNFIKDSLLKIIRSSQRRLTGAWKGRFLFIDKSCP